MTSTKSLVLLGTRKSTSSGCLPFTASKIAAFCFFVHVRIVCTRPSCPSPSKISAMRSRSSFGSRNVVTSIARFLSTNGEFGPALELLIRFTHGTQPPLLRRHPRSLRSARRMRYAGDQVEGKVPQPDRAAADRRGHDDLRKRGPERRRREGANAGGLD